MGNGEVIPGRMIWNLGGLYGKEEDKIIFKGTGPICRQFITGVIWKPVPCG